MEVVYSVSKAAFLPRDQNLDDKSLLALSCRNVLAFSSCTALTRSNNSGNTNGNDGNGREKSDKSCAVSAHQQNYYLYVCDLDKPWDIHLVTSHDDKMLCLEWDVTGSRLLVVVSGGKCEVWMMKDHLLNCWVLEITSCMAGEDILRVSWLHSGLMHNFLADKKDAVYYSDKYTRSKISPSVSQFGGLAHDGWIAVASTGLVSVSVIKSDKQVTTCTENLGPVRTRIVLADVSFMDNGQIHIVTSDGNIFSSIQCYCIDLKMQQNSVIMVCNPANSFFPHCHLDPNLNDSPNIKLTHLKFLSAETHDTVFLCCVCNNRTVMELWKLQENISFVHHAFTCSSNTSSDNKHMALKWTLKTNLRYNSAAVAIGMPRFPIIQCIPDPTFSNLQYIAVAFRDHSIQLVNKISFHIVANIVIEPSAVLPKDDTKTKIDPTLVTLQQSCSGCCIVGMDISGVLYLLRPISLREQSQQVPPSYIVSLLEYALVTGFDWWDVMLLIKLGSVDNVLVRFHDNFYKQPHSVQEYLYTRFMGIRASLFRCSIGSQQRVADCLSKLLLNSVATAFKSIFRPKAPVCQEKSPAEKLSITCSKYTETELDKILLLLNLETKEFIVEPGTLQSFQQLIQWVADFTLFLLSSVPFYQTSSSFPGSSIIHDTSALMALRELLVIIRIWGLINPSCAPIFITSTNLDCMSLIFKLLTKVWLLNKDGNMEFDDSLVDECCLLPSHMFIPNMEQIMVQDGRHFALLQSQQAVHFEYGVVPQHFARPSTFSMHFDMHSPCLQRRDCVHQINLGNVPAEKIKECTRCGNVSLLRTTIKSNAMKAWDQRWSRMCMCGGQWKLAK